MPSWFSQWRDPDSNRGHHDFQSCGVVGNAGASTTFKTTRFVGQQAFGTLAFHASDPSLCNSSGLTAAHITGILGHVGDRP
jgi:hypothetical protein